jgi:hypothetical protein
VPSPARSHPCPPLACRYEKKLLAENMRKLEEEERSVHETVVALAEARAQGAATAALEASLKKVGAQAEIYRGDCRGIRTRSPACMPMCYL